MVRRSTWIVLGVFVVLVGFAVFFQRYQTNQAKNSATATPTVVPVFLFKLGEDKVAQIKIADNTGKYIDISRDAGSSSWAVEGVPPEQVDSSLIDSASTSMLAIKVQETLADTLSLDAIGLQTPAYTITLTTSAGTQLVTYVGTLTAIGTGYYVKDNSGQIEIVDKTGLDDLLNLLKTPPLLPTATPELTPSEAASTAVPTGQETPTP